MCIRDRYYTCSVWRKFHKSACDYDRIHLFVIISVLIAANFESYLWGINQVVTLSLIHIFPEPAPASLRLLGLVALLARRRSA